MSQSKVAGTVMLNLENGEKKFLVEKEKNQFHFISTTIDSNYTSLACMLKELKDVVKLDTSKMDLFELTNLTVSSESMPLFVFTLEEADLVPKNSESQFIWEDPKVIKGVLDGIDISGVPFFC
ncbi:hypothetical protein CBF34_00010 [Vagococcus penaei]|uniref:Uncharacterized protein n=1 Tax=Vagococcus penaei TaxID=633807 RepID=A0A1Q2D5C4_9ENTE|nr:hypothetical protein [Vagococcus penaei]AQP53485.1 hypothetical protein BW732_04085 [Vagococcus penaei]RSU07430.1 hypothetical protein CBF34_00010 [Vagococcus penaei]